MIKWILGSAFAICTSIMLLSKPADVNPLLGSWKNTSSKHRCQLWTFSEESVVCDGHVQPIVQSYKVDGNNITLTTGNEYFYINTHFELYNNQRNYIDSNGRIYEKVTDSATNDKVN